MRVNGQTRRETTACYITVGITERLYKYIFNNVTNFHCTTGKLRKLRCFDIEDMVFSGHLIRFC